MAGSPAITDPNTLAALVSGLQWQAGVAQHLIGMGYTGDQPGHGPPDLGGEKPLW